MSRYTSIISGYAWTVEDPFTEYLTDVVNPSFASRMDDKLSVCFWKDSYLTIDTLEHSSPNRLTLPIPTKTVSVAIDANGGVHILSVNAEHELWHRYYFDGGLTEIRLSGGPACKVVAVAGIDDTCHVAYTTFSEDFNLNEVN